MERKLSVPTISSELCFIFQELNDIRKSGIKVFRDIRVDEANILQWQGLIVPVSCENSFQTVSKLLGGNGIIYTVLL